MVVFKYMVRKFALWSDGHSGYVEVPSKGDGL
jgi:hypothetical protein